MTNGANGLRAAAEGMMDYTTRPLGFKVRKTARYIRLYGFRRTLRKIEGQYHMNRRFASLPRNHRQSKPTATVAIIGCGNFAYSTVAYYLAKNYGSVIRATMDVDINRAASLFKRYSASYYTDDADHVFSDSAIDIVFIASNHASHADYAVKALEAGKSVHIEKPHVVRDEQLDNLCRAMASSTGRVSLGFNRPNSFLARAMKAYLSRESGPAMYNWFVAGHQIPPDHWYFKDEEGGRVLGNLCHWTDFLFQMVPPDGRFPIRIQPTRAEKSDADIALAYLFADESIGCITFSAKGETFEGVKERFAGHRGNVLITMDDFKSAEIDIGPKKRRIILPFRNHGHETTICRSYEMGTSGAHQGCSIRYVWETAQLFLRTKEALERNEEVVVLPYPGNHPGAPIIESGTIR